MCCTPHGVVSAFIGVHHKCLCCLNGVVMSSLRPPRARQLVRLYTGFSVQCAVCQSMDQQMHRRRYGNACQISERFCTGSNHGGVLDSCDDHQEAAEWIKTAEWHCTVLSSERVQYVMFTVLLKVVERVQRDMWPFR